MSTDDFKVPPYNQESEEAVLGAMLLSPAAIGAATGMIAREDFYIDAHRIIFDAIKSMYEDGKPTDPLAVSDNLKARHLLKGVGDRAYVYTLQSTCPNAGSVRHYADNVRELAMRRRLIEAGQAITTLGYQTHNELEGQLEKAEQAVYGVGERLRRDGLRPVGGPLDDSIARVLEARERGSRITGLRTGFGEIDAYTCGLQPSNLIVIGGRTSMGKTSLALNIATYAALHQGEGVLIFSMEMSATEIADRMIQAHAHIDSSDYHSGQLDDRQVARAHSARNALAAAPILIDDGGDHSLSEIRSVSRRSVSTGNVGLIVVDYIQLLHGEGRNAENRAQEMSKIARFLKVMAMELKVPVLVASQLKRSVSGMAPRAPQLEDLKESGSIEQAADVVLLLYRPELDEPNRERRLELAGVADIHLAKHRNGRCGKFRLVWVPSYSSFYNPEAHAGQEAML